MVKTSCGTKLNVTVGAPTPPNVIYQVAHGCPLTPISKLTTQMDVCTDTNVTLTLPEKPRMGRQELVINNTGNGITTVKSLDIDIVGQNADKTITIYPRSSAIFSVATCGEGGTWSVIRGASSAS